MNFTEIVKPTPPKFFVTILLMFIIFISGALVFNNPIWLKTGCAPNPTCPTCEICMSWGFPGIVRLEALLLIIPLYLIAAFIISLIYYEKNKYWYWKSFDNKFQHSPSRGGMATRHRPSTSTSAVSSVPNGSGRRSCDCWSWSGERMRSLPWVKSKGILSPPLSDCKSCF